MRKRKIIKRGKNSFAIAIMKEDLNDFGIKEGSIVDIEDVVVVKK